MGRPSTRTVFLSERSSFQNGLPFELFAGSRSRSRAWVTSGLNTAIAMGAPLMKVAPHGVLFLLGYVDSEEAASGRRECGAQRPEDRFRSDTASHSETDAKMRAMSGSERSLNLTGSISWYGYRKMLTLNGVGGYATGNGHESSASQVPGTKTAVGAICGAVSPGRVRHRGGGNSAPTLGFPTESRRIDGYRLPSGMTGNQEVTVSHPLAPASSTRRPAIASVAEHLYI